MQQQDHDENFNKLTRIAKFLVPMFIVMLISVLAWFEFSNEMLNINVANKNVEWSDGCSQGRCSGTPTFYIATDTETFITTQSIYDRIEAGQDYNVETEGFTGIAVHRRIDYLF
jgi:hypothetical protein